MDMDVNMDMDMSWEVDVDIDLEVDVGVHMDVDVHAGVYWCYRYLIHSYLVKKTTGNYTLVIMTLSPLQNVLLNPPETSVKTLLKGLCLGSELSASLHCNIATLHKNYTPVLPASQREAERTNDTVPYNTAMQDQLSSLESHRIRLTFTRPPSSLSLSLSHSPASERAAATSFCVE